MMLDFKYGDNASDSEELYFGIMVMIRPWIWAS